MADITGEANLSLGIVNLHFQSKEKLLIETLRYVADEYNEGQVRILGPQNHNDVGTKMQALIDFDLSAKVCQKNKLAVWFAFWGESKARPTYQTICSESDIDTESAILALFQQAIEEEGYQNVNPALMAKGYTALIDGLWLDLLITPKELDREMAKKITTQYLATVFPRHIAADN